jgi:hypothetical protein
LRVLEILLPPSPNNIVLRLQQKKSQKGNWESELWRILSDHHGDSYVTTKEIPKRELRVNGAGRRLATAEVSGLQQKKSQKGNWE